MEFLGRLLVNLFGLCYIIMCIALLFGLIMAPLMMAVFLLKPWLLVIYLIEAALFMTLEQSKRY